MHRALEVTLLAAGVLGEDEEAVVGAVPVTGEAGLDAVDEDAAVRLRRSPGRRVEVAALLADAAAVLGRDVQFDD